MDRQANPEAGASEPARALSSQSGGRVSRRRVLKLGSGGLACLSLGGAVYYLVRGGGSPGKAVGEAVEDFDSAVKGISEAVADAVTTDSAEVFKKDAPTGELWEMWQQRGWVKEAKHYLKQGRNVHCKLCPNECRLEPEDRGHCRNRVNKDGTLYTMAYGNACSINPDPIEKKPLFHFLPGTKVFSFAISGCGFRCLNCQNWEISQRKPEESKDPRGEAIRLTPRRFGSLTREEFDRMSMFPEDAVLMAEHLGTPSIAYTYSEPTVWFEYMTDTARAARERNIKNVWVTCGYIQQEPLVELCKVIDAANVDLKSFSEEIYKELNTGKLQPILDTLTTLKREGVWFEVTNLVVPTYTDKPEMIRRMCDWMVQSLGPDYPLHFSRFHPEHKLLNLPSTPIKVLREARDIARQCGLHYVYIGNVRDVEGAQTTICPGCGKTLVQRDAYFVSAVNIQDGKCKSCGREIAGVWSA